MDEQKSLCIGPDCCDVGCSCESETCHICAAPADLATVEDTDAGKPFAMRLCLECALPLVGTIDDYATAEGMAA